MPDKDHLNLIKEGNQAIVEWRKSAGGRSLDLSETDLRGYKLKGCQLHGSNFQNSNLSGMDLFNVNFDGANLKGANLKGANLEKALFRRSNLQNANFTNANLTASNFQDAQNVRDAHFTGANFDAVNLNNIDLSECNLQKISFRRAHLNGINFNDAQLYRTDFYETKLSGCSFKNTFGMPASKNLETIIIASRDINYFELCNQKFTERLFDWEHIRTFGKLPLFGASYVALILIPIVFYCFALYNEKIEMVRVWAQSLLGNPDNPLFSIAVVVVDYLHPLLIPKMSLLMLISTVLLAIASTCYTLFCPSRVKEFSKDQWVDQLDKPLIHYWPFSWRFKWIRIISFACYVVGGAGVLFVILKKVFNAGVFVLQHTQIY